MDKKGKEREEKKNDEEKKMKKMRVNEWAYWLTMLKYLKHLIFRAHLFPISWVINVSFCVFHLIGSHVYDKLHVHSWVEPVLSSLPFFSSFPFLTWLSLSSWKWYCIWSWNKILLKKRSGTPTRINLYLHFSFDYN